MQPILSSGVRIRDATYDSDEEEDEARTSRFRPANTQTKKLKRYSPSREEDKHLEEHNITRLPSSAKDKRGLQDDDHGLGLPEDRSTESNVAIAETWNNFGSPFSYFHRYGSAYVDPARRDHIESQDGTISYAESQNAVKVAPVGHQPDQEFRDQITSRQTDKANSSHKTSIPSTAIG